MKNNRVFKAVSLSMALAAVMAVSPISNVHADDAAKDKKATKASEEKVLDGSATEANAKEKSNKKVKASEKDVKAYEALKKARYNNTVKVRAAQLLIQIAPNRVKEVRGQLDSLIKDSQELVKKADKMIEQLEAKYEF